MNYDTIIIGFGKAGKTLAGALAKSGKSVALIEKSDQMYGGHMHQCWLHPLKIASWQCSGIGTAYRREL